MPRRSPNRRRGERYKEARKRADMTLQEVASRFGLDKSTVHRWETGENKPQDTVAVAELYGCSAAYLDYGTDATDEPPYAAWRAFRSAHALDDWRLEVLKAVRFPDSVTPTSETYERLLFALQSASPRP